MMHKYSNLFALQLLQTDHAQCVMSMKLKMKVLGELHEMSTFEFRCGKIKKHRRILLSFALTL